MTKNEAAMIARCIESVAWADEILVIDSGSTDATKKIAASLGASVYEQDWLGFSAQRNRGAELAQHDWIFFLDADEIVTAELATAIMQVMQNAPDPQDGYAVDRRGDFLGLLLPNTTKPSKRRNFIRLCNRNYSAYDTNMIVHEEIRFPGKAIPLEGALLHWNGLTIDEYILLFNRYATAEAQALNQQGVHARPSDLLIRPLARFFWTYLFVGDWRLGTRGLMHALLKATSDYIRYAKLWEMQNTKPTPHPPATLYQPPPNTPLVSTHSKKGKE